MEYVEVIKCAMGGSEKKNQFICKFQIADSGVL